MRQDSQILNERRKIWKSKKILKKLYHNWYQLIGRNLRPGSILEIGGGSGNLKEFFPDAISSDIQFAPWADTVLDAHQIPIKDAILDNIVLFDVLHHLIDPVSFFREAQRTLKKKGRILLIEPYISWFSFFIYRFLHPERMIWNIDPFKKGGACKDKNYFYSNQAIPTLIFERNEKIFVGKFPRLKIFLKKRMDFILCPLSGGFHNPSLCPLFLYSTFNNLEKILYPFNRFLAFRIFVVLEKI